MHSEYYYTRCSGKKKKQRVGVFLNWDEFGKGSGKGPRPFPSSSHIINQIEIDINKSINK